MKEKKKKNQKNGGRKRGKKKITKDGRMKANTAGMKEDIENGRKKRRKERKLGRWFSETC